MKWNQTYATDSKGEDGEAMAINIYEEDEAVSRAMASA